MGMMESMERHTGECEQCMNALKTGNHAKLCSDGKSVMGEDLTAMAFFLGNLLQPIISLFKEDSDNG